MPRPLCVSLCPGFARVGLRRGEWLALHAVEGLVRVDGLHQIDNLGPQAANMSLVATDGEEHEVDDAVDEQVSVSADNPNLVSSESTRRGSEKRRLTQ